LLFHEYQEYFHGFRVNIGDRLRLTLKYYDNYVCSLAMQTQPRFLSKNVHI